MIRISSYFFATFMFFVAFMGFGAAIYTAISTATLTPLFVLGGMSLVPFYFGMKLTGIYHGKNRVLGNNE